MAEKLPPELKKNTKAGLTLSKFLKTISEEVTEMVKDSDGSDKLVSKSEALARLIWKHALGYKDTTIDDKGRELVTIYPPDRTAWNLLFDRTEGKVSAVADESKKSTALIERITEQGKKRINAAGGILG